MAVNGLAIGAVAGGIVFVYAGLKGYSIPATVQSLITGKSPVGQKVTAPVPVAAEIASAAAAASGSVTLGAGTTSGAPATGPAVTGGGNAGTYQAYAFSLFHQYGWGPGEQQPLVSLWTGESNWDPTAYNPGTHTTNPDNSHAFGIPQALPADKMASAGADWRTNGFTQIRWGLGYISGVYGSPSNAYAKWLSRNPHWY